MRYPREAQRLNSADGKKRGFLTVRWNELLEVLWKYLGAIVFKPLKQEIYVRNVILAFL